MSYEVNPTPMTERRRSPFPGFAEMQDRRRLLADALVERRLVTGLSQTEVAARMGTSQSAVARIESGAADVKLSTLERYAVAVGMVLDVQLRRDQR